MKYDVVILAGGENSSDLRKIAPYDNEALIIIGNYPMIYYVYKSLRSSPLVENIIVSGPADSLRSILPREDNLYFVNGGENAIDSFSQAIELLDKIGTTEYLLVAPTDIPLITSEAIEDFMHQCEKYDADFYYPVTSKKVNEEKFPGVARTYVRLREGVFTGGNLFIMRKAMIPKGLEFAKQMVENRKNPLKMARILGISLAWKLIWGRLAIPVIEKRFYDMTGIRGKAVISDYAEVGVDVDKPSDLELAQKYLEGVSF